MELVIIESPYAGDVEKNIAYARAAVKDCLSRGEAPYASHLFFTQEGLLDDAVPEERRLGIQAGLAWGKAAAKTVIYADLGMSEGMHQGFDRAIEEGRPIEFRSIPGWK